MAILCIWGAFCGGIISIIKASGREFMAGFRPLDAWHTSRVLTQQNVIRLCYTVHAHQSGFSSSDWKCCRWSHKALDRYIFISTKKHSTGISAPECRSPQLSRLNLFFVPCGAFLLGIFVCHIFYTFPFFPKSTRLRRFDGRPNPSISRVHWKRTIDCTARRDMARVKQKPILEKQIK